MPAKSKKQLKFMKGVAHGMKLKDGDGPSVETAKHFVSATKKLPKK